MVDAVVSGPTRNVLRSILGKIIFRLDGAVPSHTQPDWLGNYTAQTRLTCAPNDGTGACIKDRMRELRRGGAIFVANPVNNRCLLDESIL